MILTWFAALCAAVSLVAFSGVSEASARGAENCFEFFRTAEVKPLFSLVPINQELFLTERDHALIKEIFESNADLDSKLEKAGDVYIDARLREFEVDEQKLVRGYLRTFKVTFNDKKFVANSNEIVLPSVLAETVVISGILMHEKEHRIQLYKYWREPTGRTRRTLKMLVSRFFGVRTTFMMERDAMKQEWEFLHAIPDDVIQQSVAIVKSSQTPHKALLLRMLTGSRLTQTQYIKQEHSKGRYSYTMNAAIASAHAVSTAGFLYMVVSLFH